jgi:hypothetical protein
MLKERKARRSSVRATVPRKTVWSDPDLGSWEARVTAELEAEEAAIDAAVAADMAAGWNADDEN